MFRRVSSFILALSISLGGFSAEARALSCSSVFSVTSQYALEKVDNDSNHFLFQGQEWTQYSQNFSWLRQRRVRKLLQGTELSQLVSEKAVERYAIELSAALFGGQGRFSKWLNSPEQRLEDSMILHLKEQILREGFLRTWADVHDPAQVSALKKVLDRMQNFIHGNIGQLLRLPWVLPQIRNQEVSAELLHKVIRDGFDAHAEEVRLALKKQTLIDAYKTFRKLYTPVIFGVLMTWQGHQFYHQQQALIEAQAQQTVQQLKKIRETIGQNALTVKQDLFQQAYEASIAEFIQTWGEAPTPEEQNTIKTKINKALNIH